MRGGGESADKEGREAGWGQAPAAYIAAWLARAMSLPVLRLKGSTESAMTANACTESANCRSSEPPHTGSSNSHCTSTKNQSGAKPCEGGEHAQGRRAHQEAPISCVAAAGRLQSVTKRLGGKTMQGCDLAACGGWRWHHRQETMFPA